jgi:hypothetical protein
MAIKHDEVPWWREPWPWFLMLGPAVAIIACIITITLAFKNFSDQPIYDGTVKRGLVVDRPASSSSPGSPSNPPASAR